jgi:carbon-monoxide dehydrogenase small subunit
MEKIDIALKVNGESVEASVEPGLSLLSFLREHLGLTGTKQGCGRGDCGSCTVLLDDSPVLSCITFAFQADGKAITTIEGIAQGARMSRIQEIFVERGAVQCGFCTPAMILVGESFLRKNPDPTREEIREAISGVLCRCTGYKKIVDAIEQASGKAGREADLDNGSKRKSPARPPGSR